MTSNPIDYWYQKYVALKRKMDEMMENAIECRVCTRDVHDGRSIDFDCEYPKPLKPNERVKLIIIKEDKK